MPQRQSSENIESSVDGLDIQIPMYHVILYNDDYTTFEFVIGVLITVFSKSEQDAVRITRSVHERGKGIAGTYPLEVAQMKVSQVHQMAENAGFPLRAGIES